MREIKFRVWDSKFQKMVDSKDVVIDASTGFKSGCRGGGGDVEWWLLMQYTGIKDKNRVEIYEGDIYHQGDANIKYKVIFKDGQFVGNQLTNPSLAGLSYWSARIEVIGNIHENPELLK